MMGEPRITRVRPVDEPTQFKVGDRVKLRPDARNVLDVIQRHINGTVGEIVGPDEGDFDWSVRFPEGRRVGGMYAFDSGHLICVWSCWVCRNCHANACPLDFGGQPEAPCGHPTRRGGGA